MCVALSARELLVRYELCRLLLHGRLLSQVLPYPACHMRQLRLHQMNLPSPKTHDGPVRMLRLFYPFRPGRMEPPDRYVLEISFLPLRWCPALRACDSDLPLSHRKNHTQACARDNLPCMRGVGLTWRTVQPVIFHASTGHGDNCWVNSG